MEKFKFVLFVLGVVIMLATLIIDMFFNMSKEEKVYLCVAFFIGFTLVVGIITYEHRIGR